MCRQYLAGYRANPPAIREFGRRLCQTLKWELPYDAHTVTYPSILTKASQWQERAVHAMPSNAFTNPWKPVSKGSPAKVTELAKVGLSVLPSMLGLKGGAEALSEAC